MMPSFRVSPFARVALATFSLVLGLPAALCAQTVPPASAQADEQPPASLAAALDLVARRDWDGAATMAAALDPVTADIVAWSRLRAGQGTLDEYRDFLDRRADWPGLDLLRTRAEARLGTGVPPDGIIAWFGERDPVTADGLIVLSRALRQAGRTADAAALLSRVWPVLTLDAPAQARLLADPGVRLTAADHQARLDHLLWEGREAEARRMFDLVPVGWRQLAEARLALRDPKAKGVDALVLAVPPALAADPGLTHGRFDWRARNDRTEAAIEILQGASVSSEQLGRPASWARRRAVLARAMLRDGKPQLAYELAARHRLERGADRADLEFLAGWIALRDLGQAQIALEHFTVLAEIVATPISVSRAEYWRGRALAALGHEDLSREAMTQAARHQTAYYGLLAAEYLGLPLDPALAHPDGRGEWRGHPFLASSVTEAALLLYQAGNDPLARRFLLHLAEGMDEQGLRALGAFALEKGDVHLAVLLGKQAATRGIILPEIYYPEARFIPEGLETDRPLVLAIARRESEFLPSARSSAGALGLMQVMPGTATMMARKLGLPDNQADLTLDSGYNARLGAAYLAHLAEEFGPSIALRAVGYNAGPGRSRSWITLLGDPRGKDVDIVDWVESIPFSETRTYVMRVLEGVAIYGARAAAAAGRPPEPIDVTGLLRGTSG